VFDLKRREKGWILCLEKATRDGRGLESLILAAAISSRESYVLKGQTHDMCLSLLRAPGDSRGSAADCQVQCYSDQ
jgi:hypothetical protein